MKNLLISIGRNQLSKKIIIKMKLTFAFLLFGLITVSASTYSQNTRLDISIKDNSIIELFRQIEEKSDFCFFFQKEELANLEMVSIKKKNAKVTDILNEVLSGTNLKYRIVDRYIVIKKEGENFVDDKKLSFQQKSVSGMVFDEDHNPLPGVTVVIKGTSQGTITDVNGKFILQLPSDAKTLVFSFIGMETKEIAVEGRSVIDCVLGSSNVELDEVVAIGYGTTKKRDLTGSVASIKGESIAKQATINVSQALQGTIPGMSVVNTTGTPGSGANIIIRGQGSFSNTPPLVVIDGVIGGDLNTLETNDISSLEVLKDASSAAIYGSRAANGVIIITTNRGKNGEIKIDFSASCGVQSIAHSLDLLNAQQWRDIKVWEYTNEGEEIPENLQSANFDGSKSTNWQDELLRTATQQRYNFSVTGGSEHSNFNFSLGYVNQDGIAIESSYERISARINSDFKKGMFNFGESIGLTWEDKRGSSITNIHSWPAPVFHAFDEDGEYGSWSAGWGATSPEFLDQNNPVANREIPDSKNPTIKILANIFGTMEIIDGLMLKTSVGVSSSSWHSKTFIPTYVIGDNVTVNETADLSESRGQNYTILWENTLSYTKKIAKHQFDAVVGWTRQLDISENLSLDAENFPEGIFNADAAEDILFTSGGNVTRASLESYLGRINYSYDHKYLVTASLRRDGSSRFSEDLRWGNYPSISIGWVLSEESFFPENNVIQSLKLRGGYGELGSQNTVGAYQVQNTLDLGGYGIDYVLGNPQTLTNGVAQTSITNSNLLWEISKSTNIGLDAILFDNKISFTADFFKKDTKRLQFEAPIPQYLGLGQSNSTILVNAGDIRNKGFEANLTYHKRKGDFTFDIGANIFVLRNKVIKLNNDNDVLYGGAVPINTNTTRTEVGKSLANFYIFEYDGVFNSIEEVNEYSKNGQLIQPLAQPGDLRFKDINDDGIINDNDKRYFSGNLPDFEFGMNFAAKYKAFDMQLMMQGNIGSKIFNNVARTMKDLLASNVDHWSEDNINSDIYRPSISDPNINYRPSNYFLEESSYLRVKNIQLGYSLPAYFLSKINIASVRLSITGQNLITFTKFSGYDPEPVTFGLDRGTNVRLYPLAKTVLLGLNIRF